MLQRIKYILLVLFLSVYSIILNAAPPKFEIESNASALSIEEAINRYPDQVKFNLLYKLAMYYRDTLPEKTIQFAEQAVFEIERSENSKFLSLQIYCYVLLGKTYQHECNDYLSGLSFLKAYNLSSAVPNDALNYQILTDLCSVLSAQSNNYLNLIYLRKALRLAQNLHLKEYQIETMARLSSTYYELNQLDSARYFINKIILDGTDNESIATSYLISGKIKVIEDNLPSAMEDLQRALDIGLKINANELVANCYSEMAKYLAMQHKYLEANRILKKRTELTGLPENGNFLLMAAEISEKNNNYRDATAYYKKYITVSDSLLKNTSSISNLLFSNQLEIFKKDQSISILKTSNTKRANDVKKTRFLIIVSFTLLLMLIIATYFIMNYQREKNRNLQIISKQKEELTLKKHKEDIRKMELKTAIAQLHGQEIERERLAKELHDGVGGTLAGIKMELESIFSKLSKNPKKEYLLNSLHSTYQEVRSISKNLSLPNFSSESLNDNLIELIQNFPGKNNLSINFNAFPSKTWDEINLQTQKELYRMIQEAITNVIKHARATELDIQIVNDGETLTMIIEDNGDGFDMNKSWSGIGLKNMYSRATVLKGELSIESAPGEGTTVNLSIPVNI